MPRTCLRRRAATALTALLLVSAALVGTTPPASAGWSTLCTGYSSCARQGYAHAGYASANDTMWWRMYAGHNCTNYVAYRMVRSGMPNRRPWDGSGNATNWGVARADLLDSAPTVGSVAWWRAGSRPGGSVGHVAYVERVVSATEIVVSQDSWGGSFSWARVRRADGGWPTGFLHFNDVRLRSTGRPVVSGSSRVGGVLTATPGRWSVQPTTLRYRWTAAGRPIPGETRRTLTPGPRLVGRRLAVVVTAARRGYRSTRAGSAATRAVAAGTMTVTRAPAVVGAPRPGTVLRVRAGAFHPADAAVAVSWWRGDTRTGSGSSYRPTAADLGSRLEARTRVTRRGYLPLTTRTMLAAPVRDTARLRVRTARQGRRLVVTARVTAADVAPVPGRLVVRWRDGSRRVLRLADGRARVSLRAPSSGSRRLSVRYRGSATVSAVALSRVVRAR